MGDKKEPNRPTWDKGDYNPHDHREVELPQTDFQALANLLKSSLGTGILAMPLAFKNAGLVMGSIGTIIVGYICNHCAEILVVTANEICSELKIPSIGYGEACEQAFFLGPEHLRRFSTGVRYCTDFAMAFTYLGSCCVYIVLMTTSIKQLVELYGGAELHIAIYAIMLMPALIILVQIKNLKHLAPFSILSNFLFFAICCISFYFIFDNLGSISERKAFTSVTTFPSFLSTVIFAMEGIGIVLYIETSMVNPAHFLGCPGVLYVSMCIIIVMYGSLGFLGYWRYGEDIKATITLNLDNDNPAAQTAKVMIIIAIFFTYAIQFYVCVGIVWKYAKIKLENWEFWGEFLVRSGIVGVSVVIGVLIPKLDAIIGLVGAIFFSTLGLFGPAFIQIIFRWDRDLGKLRYILWKNILIIIFSILTLVCGCATAIWDLIHD